MKNAVSTRKNALDARHGQRGNKRRADSSRERSMLTFVVADGVVAAGVRHPLERADELASDQEEVQAIVQTHVNSLRLRTCRCFMVVSFPDSRLSAAGRDLAVVEIERGLSAAERGDCFTSPMIQSLRVDAYPLRREGYGRDPEEITRKGRPRLTQEEGSINDLPMKEGMREEPFSASGAIDTLEGLLADLNAVQLPVIEKFETFLNADLPRVRFDSPEEKKKVVTSLNAIVHRIDRRLVRRTGDQTPFTMSLNNGSFRADSLQGGRRVRENLAPDRIMPLSTAPTPPDNRRRS